MNNILNLYNIELRRIYKWLVALLGVLVAGNVFMFLRTITNTVNLVANDMKAKASISMLKSSQAKEFLVGEYELSNMIHTINLLLGLCVLICLVYALIIWYRDILGKSKTGYALFMLPQNKFNVYISKALTIITMIYSVILVQAILFIIELTVITLLAGISSGEMSIILNPRFTLSLSLIQPYFIDFVMINVLGVILAVVVIFTGVMIQKSYKISGIVLGLGYILGSIFVFFYLTRVAQYTDQLLLYHGVYYIAIFIVSIGLSYSLLNKKVYI